MKKIKKGKVDDLQTAWKFYRDFMIEGKMWIDISSKILNKQPSQALKATHRGAYLRLGAYVDWIDSVRSVYGRQACVKWIWRKDKRAYACKVKGRIFEP